MLAAQPTVGGLSFQHPPDLAVSRSEMIAPPRRGAHRLVGAMAVRSAGIRMTATLVTLRLELGVTVLPQALNVGDFLVGRVIPA
jgi:hypothetical protein